LIDGRWNANGLADGRSMLRPYKEKEHNSRKEEDEVRQRLTGQLVID
jgi:hypothetical protein